VRTDGLQCMEQFKAVEKEMKTKAYSKEGLSQNVKQDPKEREREELCDFLAEQLDEIGRFLETIEAEEESLQVAVKKNKRDTSKADRLSEIQVVTERFKWHEGKIQLLLRALQNGNVDNQQVLDIKDDIEYVVKDGREADFDAENDTLYDDCNLDSEEAQFGLGNDLDKISSQDAQSIQDDNETDIQIKKTKTEPPPGRRPSTQLKSPLQVQATLNTIPPPPSLPKETTMKPAPLPAIPPGQTLKYASAAAAATASDKSGVGIAPLPPPLNASPTPATAPLPAPMKPSNPVSPASVAVQPVEKAAASDSTSAHGSTSQDQSNLSSRSKSPALSQTSAPAASVTNSVPQTPAMENVETVPSPVIADEIATTNGDIHEEAEDEESIYHLPPDLQDLIQSFETTKSRKTLQPTPSVQRLLQASQETCPTAADAERPRHYKPQFRFSTPAHYPQEPLPLFDDPSLYETGRIDTDTLFYIFYYRQGTYQQYLAAKSLKSQSWRFHKQYQTWFQRHEEPKMITDEYEQGTYRFFDYESTWYALDPHTTLPILR
jgi:CCR4-NOT transcription complex subunit 3